jgi:hypothetical protein
MYSHLPHSLHVVAMFQIDGQTEVINHTLSTMLHTILKSNLKL